MLTGGRVGQTYAIGGNCEQTNLSIVQTICRLVQLMRPELPHRCEELITHVTDRLGHDRRYAIDSTKIQQELGWQPQVDFHAGLQSTVRWYLNNSRP